MQATVCLNEMSRFALYSYFTFPCDIFLIIVVSHIETEDTEM